MFAVDLLHNIVPGRVESGRSLGPQKAISGLLLRLSGDWGIWQKRAAIRLGWRGRSRGRDTDKGAESWLAIRCGN